jgi:hypothetical protein
MDEEAVNAFEGKFGDYAVLLFVFVADNANGSSSAAVATVAHDSRGEDESDTVGPAVSGTNASSGSKPQARKKLSRKAKGKRPVSASRDEESSDSESPPRKKANRVKKTTVASDDSRMEISEPNQLIATPPSRLPILSPSSATIGIPASSTSLSTSLVQPNSATELSSSTATSGVSLSSSLVSSSVSNGQGQSSSVPAPTSSVPPLVSASPAQSNNSTSSLDSSGISWHNWPDDVTEDISKAQMGFLHWAQWGTPLIVSYIREMNVNATAYVFVDGHRQLGELQGQLDCRQKVLIWYVCS